MEALEAALRTAQPEIFNTDQDSQFTNAPFTERLQSRGIAISMARKRAPRRGRALVSPGA